MSEDYVSISSSFIALKYDSVGENPFLSGRSLILDSLKKIPSSPGVYRMIAKTEEVIYVGKARNLKKRIASYARNMGHTHRIERMIHEIVAIEFLVTRNEVEALLLEANLIKSVRPRYNVLLRDDKSFPSILLTTNHPCPGVFKYRGKSKEEGERFGPFASANAVMETIASLQKSFLLRTCRDSFLQNRTRPCLLYQIKRCAGPCTGEISVSAYYDLVQQAKDFLSGRSQSVKATIVQQMQASSDALDFESAALYRNRLMALSFVQSHQGVDLQDFEDSDVFALFQQEGYTCIQVFFFRHGQNRGGKTYFPEADASIEPGEIFASFLGQFYDNATPPKNILVSISIKDQALFACALSLRAGYPVRVHVPLRGRKKDIMEHALENAKAAFVAQRIEHVKQKKLFESFVATFNLQKIPQRIEVYDNSHFVGNAAVGVMIVAGQEGFMKGEYRKFHISSADIHPGDDYAMMKEVMKRRFFSYESLEENEQKNIWPDVIVIDGGIGQMSAVKEVLSISPSAKNIFFLAMAKGKKRQAGEEKIFFAEEKKPFPLANTHPVFHFLQRLQDEVHRFAVGAHRNKRKKNFMSNPLDDINGIGPKRKRALLHHFGTVQAIGRASIRDLMLVEGVSQAMAYEIYQHFHA